MSNEPFGETVGLPPDKRSRVGHPQLVLPDGLVGVEIELEDFALIHDFRTQLSWWSIVDDGSLRGCDAHELVLSHPLCGKDLIDALAQVDGYIRGTLGRPPTLSHRCSVHVHLDIREMTVEQICTLNVITCAVEPLLFKYVGEHRKENPYCLPLTESKMLREHISSGLPNVQGFGHNFADMCKNYNKYTALNMRVATNLGSAEFRHMPGEWRKEKILEWINILLCLKKYSMECNTPADLLPALVSDRGPYQFLEDVFGDYAKFILAACEDDRTIISSIYSSIRKAQDIVHGTTMVRESMRLRKKLAESDAPITFNPMYTSRNPDALNNHENPSRYWRRRSQMGHGVSLMSCSLGESESLFKTNPYRSTIFDTPAYTPDEEEHEIEFDPSDYD